MQSLGQHTLLEYGGCDPALLEKAPRIRQLLCAAVRHGGGSIVKTMFHNFSPYGVSGVVVITESHVTIHTWPEHGYAAVDIFSCSPKLKHRAIRDELRRALKAKTVGQRTFQRGIKAPRNFDFCNHR